MLWKGPSGLPGEPPEEKERYAPYPIEGHEHLTCWVRDDVEPFLEESGKTTDGDYLFGTEAAGRLRFRFVDADAPKEPEKGSGTVDWKKVPKETVVCYCNSVTKQAIVRAIAGGAATFDAVKATTGAGAGNRCAETHPEKRCCAPDVEELIRLYAPAVQALGKGCT